MLQKLIIKRDFSTTLSMQQWLIISCGFSSLLLTARIIVTGYPTYLFLVWNLFLAFVPYAITQWLWTNSWVAENKLKLAALLLCWLLFIPNSFYIITDLFHLDEFGSAPKWFDLLLIFSFAWNGLLLGIISVRKIEMVLSIITGRSFSLFIVFVVMWLNAFGIYIGRYLRFNSWDIVMQPFSLFKEMFEVIFHPVRNRMEWGMIAVYAIFMTVVYITIKKLSENFSETTKIKIK
ncbi:MAG: DUF1361 domain-containing protein [Chitinophagaceae bacterium]